LNLIEEITTDPAMVKRFLLPLREDRAFEIPAHFEDDFKSLRSLSSSDKAVLVSKVTSPENYQQQIKLLAVLQHTLDRVQELNSDLYFIQMRWHNHLKEATTWVNRQYFAPLNELRDGVRKAVLSSALSPIEVGCDRIDALIAVGEKIYSHLIATNWNLKEGSSLIKEYLTTLSSPMRSSL
jgi:hypothetical protein